MNIKFFSTKNRSIIFFNIVMFVIVMYALAFLLHLTDPFVYETYTQIKFDRAVLIYEYIICSFTFATVFTLILRLVEKEKI